MRTSTSTHTASDGTPIHVHRWDPDDGVAVRAIAHISHGMAEHAGRYARLAEALTQAGIRVYGHDHRGHGKTVREEEWGHIGDADGWAHVVHDLRDLLRAELAENPGKPLVLFGHSMGSFMAQEILYTCPDWIAAAVLSGTDGKPIPLAAAGRAIARLERLRLGPRGKSSLLHNLSFGAFNKAFAPNRTAHDWLSRDDAEVDKYESDPMCGFVCTTSTWIGVLDALAANARPENQAKIRKDLPVYIVSGSEDPVNNRARGVRQLVGAYYAAGLTDVTLRVYEGARHEIFNETNRDEVTEALVSWIRQKVL